MFLTSLLYLGYSYRLFKYPAIWYSSMMLSNPDNRGYVDNSINYFLELDGDSVEKMSYLHDILSYTDKYANITFVPKFFCESEIVRSGYHLLTHAKQSLLSTSVFYYHSATLSLNNDVRSAYLLQALKQKNNTLLQKLFPANRLLKANMTTINDSYIVDNLVPLGFSPNSLFLERLKQRSMGINLAKNISFAELLAFTNIPYSPPEYCSNIQSAFWYKNKHLINNVFKDILLDEKLSAYSKHEGLTNFMHTWQALSKCRDAKPVPELQKVFNFIHLRNVAANFIKNYSKIIEGLQKIINDCKDTLNFWNDGFSINKIFPLLSGDFFEVITFGNFVKNKKEIFIPSLRRLVGNFSYYYLFQLNK